MIQLNQKVDLSTNEHELPLDDEVLNKLVELELLSYFFNLFSSSCVS